MTLRIAQVCADRGIAPGGTKGASLHLRGVAAGFVDLGHEVVTFAHRKLEGDFPTEVRPVESLLTSGPVDVFYERYSLGHLGGLREARRRGVPFVLEVNAPLVEEATQHRPDTVKATDRAAEDQLLTEADLVVVVSSELARWAGSHRRGRPTVMLSNGFEPAWFDGPAPAIEFDLAFIGHPKPWHGADRIPALLRALRDRGLPVTALVIGGGDAAEALRKDAQRLDVADALVVTGPLAPPDAARRLRTARIGLAPYRQITPFYFCPLKVVDYLAGGLAIVASDIGDIPRLTSDAAVLVDPNDDHAFTDAVAALLANPGEIERRSDRGRTLAAGHTWTAVARATIDALNASLVAR